jgi:hypothetical protein
MSDQLDFGSMDDQFEKEKAPESKGYELLPQGTYDMTVTKVWPSFYEEGNQRQLEWRLVVDGPRHAGKKVARRNTVEPDQLKWLKKDLAACEVELKGGTLNALNDQDWLDGEFVGLRVQVYVAHKKKGDKTYANYYFNKRLGKRDLTAEENAPVEEGGEFSGGGGGGSTYTQDDDAPF